MRATVEWSLDLLEASERAVFRRMAVFAGGGPLEAVEAVCSPVGRGRQGALDTIASLVDKSLMRQVELPSGQARLVMLGTIREMATEQLAASGEAEETHRRHAAWYQALVQQIDPAMSQEQAVMWLEGLEQERGNLRTALSWSLEHDEGEMAIQLSAAVWRAERAAALHEAALALLRRLHQSGSLAPLADELGQATSEQGEYARATVVYEEGRAQPGEGGDGAETSGVATTLLSLGEMLLDHRDTARAAVLYRESLALCQEVGDRLGSVLSLEGLGDLAVVQGRAERAAHLWGAAESWREASGARPSWAHRARAEHYRTMARAQIGEAAFGAARLHGQAMAFPEAIKHALDD
jgi:hypothetical protein